MMDETLSLEQIDKAVRQEMEKLLLEAKVWEYDTFGWASADDADPEYIGYTMQAVEPPIDFNFFERRKPNRQPKNHPEWKRLLAVSGADFEGLLISARNSIGLFLIQAKLLKHQQFYEQGFFDLHWISSLIYLATATERLREFFIAAAFRKKQECYFSGELYKGQRRKKFATPFHEASETLTSVAEEAQQALAKALPMIAEIEKLRTKRNKLIHKLATVMGHIQEKIVNDVSAANTSEAPDDFDSGMFNEMKRHNEETHANMIRERTQELVDWYSFLFKVSNEIFVFEFHLRKED